MNETRQIAPFGPAPAPSPSPPAAPASARSSLIVAVAIALWSALGGLWGCAHAPPPPIQPWQREHLSRRAMRFDADPLETRFRQHMFGSREGAEGGYGQPGGGCGCN